MYSREHLLTETMFLISFDDILNWSFTIHEIQPNFNDSTMSRLEHITDMIAQNSKRFEFNYKVALTQLMAMNFWATKNIPDNLPKRLWSWLGTSFRKTSRNDFHFILFWARILLQNDVSICFLNHICICKYYKLWIRVYGLCKITIPYVACAAFTVYYRWKLSKNVINDNYLDLWETDLF